MPDRSEKKRQIQRRTAMPAFFTDLLDHFPTDVFLEKVRVRYHYDESGTEELRETAREMLPLLQKEAFWESRPAGPGIARPFETQAKEPGEVRYERVVISLGAGVDSLQDDYSGQGRLSKSYMLEALAGELLLQSYEAYSRCIAETTGWHAARYHFPGDGAAYPLERLPGLLEGLTERVTCNQAFCLLPKKSVVFVAELTKDANVRCEGICAGCGSRGCAFRTARDAVSGAEGPFLWH